MVDTQALVDNALGGEATNAELRELITPQLTTLFDVFMSQGNEAEAQRLSNRFKEVGELCKSGKYPEAIQIMVAEGLPEGYAASMVSMVSAVHANSHVI